ncbi:cytoplasmic protein [Coprinopsis marcescibilis]|uniref:Cytoplasmic protein n=1 Tax=Coprinopsis marcescibilis TaxID=230819 RepID=A0A5C3KY86_COPMA|nr:cytoplasmic protein [Coprinopsis marcescibilis]
MQAQLLELVPFLRDRNPQARQLALSNLLPQTPQGSPYRDTLFFKGLGGGGLQKPKETDVIRDLKLLCRDQLNIAHDAFRALVNLSDSPMLIGPLSDPSFLTFIVSYIVNPQSICADLAAMLLSNLTASSAACLIVITMKIKVIQYKPYGEDAFQMYPVDSRSGSSPTPVPHPTGQEMELNALPLLIDAFVQGATMGDIDDLSKRKRKGELNFLASVFANITVSPAGRLVFLTPQPSDITKTDLSQVTETQDGKIALEYPLAKIVPFTEHKDSIRRKGVASSIKNCCFLVKAHKAILSPESERVVVQPSKVAAPGIDAVPYLLLPLAGPEEFDLDDQEKLHPSLQFLPPDKKREADANIRITVVEALILLCHTRWGRDYLRSTGVYEIVREFHLQEKEEKVREEVERLVQMLKGEEPSIQAADEEEEDIVDAELNKADTISVSTKAEDSDEEDFKIEEI